MCKSRAEGGQRCDGKHADADAAYWAAFRERTRVRYAAKHPARGVGGRKSLPADAGAPNKKPDLGAPMLVDLSPGLALAPATEGHPATDANDASAGYVKPERCDKCGATLYPGEGMVAIGVLCNRCYQDDPYDEEPRRAKKAWVAPYTTKKAWGAASAARMRAVMQAPVLTAEGDPMPKGAKVTERDGYCWTCRQPVAAGRAEAIYNGSRRRQDAACPSCTWTSAYVMVMPTITREEALGIAKMRIPMGLLHNAGRAGYTTGEILDGILTPEVIAGLPVAIALASKS